MSWEVIQGDCIEQMAQLEEASVDAVVCDPPYGIGFMGHEWDQPGEFGPVDPEEDIPLQGGKKRRRQPSPASGAGHTRERRGKRDGVRLGGPTGADNTTHTERGGAMHAGRYDLSLTANRRYQAWCEAWARECFRILKPGGHLLASCGSRTYHRLAAGIEDAGFEIRDSIMWIYGSGFPKSLNVAVAIDKAEGAPAAEWEGWGTALKPGHEPIVVARKPLTGTVAANVLEHGTGGVNVDGCRIGNGEGGDRHGEPSEQRRYTTDNGSTNFAPMPGPRGGDAAGRWPANVILDEIAALELDAQSGQLRSGANPSSRGSDKFRTTYGKFPGQREIDPIRGAETGGASRFFYCAKTSRAERNAGLDGFESKALNWSSGEESPGTFQGEGTDRSSANHHPTVKPISLMRWLVRLVTPPDGLILDPFLGSGTTGCAAVLEGFNFIGIEREAEYIEIAKARIAFWAQHEGREVEDVLGLHSASQKAARAHAELGQASFDDLLEEAAA